MSLIENVRDAVIAIPAGSVASYGDIGKSLGAGPRQVGRVDMKRAPTVAKRQDHRV